MKDRTYYLSRLRASVYSSLPADPEKEKIRKQMVEWILYRKYWDRNDRMDTICEKCGVPRNEVVSFVKNLSGKKYVSLRKELRVQDAIEMLDEHTELSIQDISRMVGLTDKSNFRRDFSSVKGTTPFKWRKEKESKNKKWISGLTVSVRNHFR